MRFCLNFRSGYPAQGTKAFTNEALGKDGEMNSIEGEFFYFFIFAYIYMIDSLVEFYIAAC
jgi:hypothetical protein